jgi:hypothetical protein
VKCSDIPDDVFMAAVEATEPMSPGGCWRHRRDVRATLERILGTELPEKLFLAKARKLGRKRRLEGCTNCSCRGDYHTPRECRRWRCCYSPDFPWDRLHPAYSPEWENDPPPPPRDPEALAKAVTETAGLFALPLAPGLAPYDLSNPARLVYPSGYVQPPEPPPAFTIGSLILP